MSTPNGEWGPWQPTPRWRRWFGARAYRRSRTTCHVGGCFVDWEYNDEPVERWAPSDPATRDQMAAVMLLKGTPTQQAEAIAHIHRREER